MPNHMQAIFDRGHGAEAWAKGELAKKGVVWLEQDCGLENQQRNGQTLALFQDLPDGRLIRLAITPDGLSRGKDGRKVAAEIKSFSKTAYKEFLRDGIMGNERYAYQFSAEIHGYRHRDRDDSIAGVIIPVIAENNPDWEPYGCDTTTPRWLFELGEVIKFEEPPFSLSQVMGRCIDIVNAYDAGEWPKCSSKYPCRWPHEAPITSDAESEAIVKRYATALAELRSAQGELETVITGFDSFLGRRVCRVALQCIEFVGEAS